MRAATVVDIDAKMNLGGGPIPSLAAAISA